MTTPPYYRSQSGYEIIQNLYTHTLTEWPIEPHSLYVETRSAKTHLLMVGDENNPALFYFHGWNGNAAGNHHELDLLRLSQKYCVYMPDTPGQTGRSDLVRMDTQGRAYADWVEDLFDQFNLAEVYLSGVSGGGYIVSKSAAYLAPRIKRALGIVPHGIPSAKRPPLKFFWAVGATAFMGKRGWQRFARKLAASDQPNHTNIKLMADFMVTMNQHFKPAWNPAPLPDEELESIDCPYQALFAKNDITMHSHKAIQRARNLIPQVDVQLLEDEGHILSPKGQQLVNDMLMAW